MSRLPEAKDPFSPITEETTSRAAILLLCFFCVALAGAAFYFLAQRSRGAISAQAATTAAAPVPVPASETPPTFGWGNPVIHDIALSTGEKAAVGPLAVHSGIVHVSISADSPINSGITSDDWKDLIVADGSYLNGAGLDDHRTVCFFEGATKKQTISCSNKFFADKPFIVFQDTRQPTIGILDWSSTHVRVVTYDWVCLKHCP